MIIYQNLSYRVIWIRVSSNLALNVIKNLIESFRLKWYLIMLRLKHNIIVLAWSSTRMIFSIFYPINSTSTFSYLINSASANHAPSRTHKILFNQLFLGCYARGLSVNQPNLWREPVCKPQSSFLLFWGYSNILVEISRNFY